MTLHFSGDSVTSTHSCSGECNVDTRQTPWRSYYFLKPMTGKCRGSCEAQRSHQGKSWELPIQVKRVQMTIAAAAKSLQSCPTLCDPIDGSPPGSPVPGILQARTLEWVAISLSNAWKWKVKVKSLSRVRPSATPWTAAYQAPPSMGFSRQEYWSGVPLPSPQMIIGEHMYVVTSLNFTTLSSFKVCSLYWSPLYWHI